MGVFTGAVFSGTQAARGLRSPRLLVQRFARPGSTPKNWACGTGGAQRTTGEEARAQAACRLSVTNYEATP